MSEPLVFLRHPDLPADQWIEVTAESRVHYSGSGWQMVPEQEVAARDAGRAHELAKTQALMAGLAEPPPPAAPDTAGADQDQGAGAAPGEDQGDQLPEPASADADADAAIPAAPAAPKKRSR